MRKIKLLIIALLVFFACAIYLHVTPTPYSYPSAEKTLIIKSLDSDTQFNRAEIDTTAMVVALITLGVLALVVIAANEKDSDESKGYSPSSEENSSTNSILSYNRLKDKLRQKVSPANFIENYDKNKVDKANIIYQKLLALNDSEYSSIIDIVEQAETELGIIFVDEEMITELKEKVSPKNFINPYNAEKISLANELYSQLIEKKEMSYTDFLCICQQATVLNVKLTFNHTYSSTEKNNTSTLTPKITNDKQKDCDNGSTCPNNGSKAGTGALIFSFFIPIIGIICYFVNKKDVSNPNAYLKAAGGGVIIGFIVRLIEMSTQN